MRIWRIAPAIVGICALSPPALADKAEEVDALTGKPWGLRSLPVLAQPSADANEGESNDSCPGNIYTLGSLFHGALDPSGDVDWVRFTCNQGDQLTIGTEPDGANPTVDTVMELYAGDCTTLLATDDDGGPGLYSLIQGFAVPVTGEYHLKVRAFSAAAAPGNYSLIGASGAPPVPGVCPVDGYLSRVATVGQPIPDGAGAVTGAVTFTPLPGFVIQDLVVDLEVDHPWVGDLVVTLRHTGPGGIVSVKLIDRPGVPSEQFGCAADLSAADGPYSFGAVQGLVTMGEPDCPAVIPPACYAVTGGTLDVFHGISIGVGTWELMVEDVQEGDEGTFHRWSLHLLAGARPVAVESRSWGEIKAGYRD